ncbi:FtsW/RodA/SpoVE family cell cycle protein [Propioniferax innocua]|uniref:Cell elongation-specific peptidoglycan biosynthesis regulator RodA n=1 Tax=Propioniferax innocua TaxID=1753 RepID=A0A542ZSV7_9ACTN|nr:FtsW/RodA/SpoVE family cell cycle protein [Propioniferax innocua]TQL63442.1 cell elongation-specific peptidoglycan biosynthesis regulator RodA [Propioniferax innocua]
MAESETTGSGMVVIYHKRRNVEAAMMLFALAIGIIGWTLVEYNLHEEVPTNLPVVAGIWVMLGLIAHLAVRIRIPYADPVILPCAMLLNGLGLTMIHRIDQISDPVATGAHTQLMWTTIGMTLFVLTVTFLRDHRRLQAYTYIMFLSGLVLLLLPLVPGLGREVMGARIWIFIGPFSFQPAEIAKIVLAVAFASYLVEKREVLAEAGARVLGIDLPRPRDLGPILIMWVASLLVLVYQRDLGTSLLFFGLFVMMLYTATERPSWPILGSAMFFGGAYVGYLLFSHVQIRVNAWLFPFSNFDQNLQVINAQYGMAWGGLIGTGLGLGRPGLTPLARSDFIAGAIGEELGTAGLMAVVMLYGLIVARGLRASLASKELFGKLLAAGLSFVFALQVFIIIGGVTRLLPLTGLTTPFMSQGGSSMIANWVIAGLLLVMSHQARKPVAPVTEDPDPDREKTQHVPAGGSA